MDPDFNVCRMTLQHIVEAKDLSQPFQMNQYIKDDKDCNDVTPNASAAFLGPNLWDEIKTQFVDIDNFFPNSPTDGPHLIENLDSCLNKDAQKQREGTNMQIPVISEAPPSVSRGYSTELISEAPPSVSRGYSTEFVRPNQVISHPATYSPTQIQRFPDMNEKSKDYSVDCKFSPTDLALATPPGDKHYDPTSKSFPEEELKPQPIIKKSRKNFVPDDLKDEKYWARRHKNNIAAKRSREARRLKENQIVLRASYLEKENNTLKEDMIRLQAENDMLKEKVTKYESLIK